MRCPDCGSDEAFIWLDSGRFDRGLNGADIYCSCASEHGDSYFVVGTCQIYITIKRGTIRVDGDYA